jgi:hypothetical protein
LVSLGRSQRLAPEVHSNVIHELGGPKVSEGSSGCRSCGYTTTGAEDAADAGRCPACGDQLVTITEEEAAMLARWRRAARRHERIARGKAAEVLRDAGPGWGHRPAGSGLP